jgi:lipooligosaccharide transport system permease protein
MRSTPITARQISLGLFIAAMVRTSVSVVIYWIALYFFGALDSDTAWLAMPAALFAGAAMAAVMLALAGKIEKEDFFFTIVGRFIMIPMFLFSGTFYSLTTLPLSIRWVGWISPLWHATEIGRYVSYRHDSSVTMQLIHFGYLTALGATGLSIAYWKFAKRLSE